MCENETSGQFDLIGAATVAGGPAVVLRVMEDMTLSLIDGGKLTLASGSAVLLPCLMQDIWSVFHLPPMAAWSAWSFSRVQAAQTSPGGTPPYWEVFLIAGDKNWSDTATSGQTGSDDDDVPR